VKVGFQIAGVAAILVGLLWIGQGTGFVDWPASSFMIDQRPWALRGALLTVIGVVLLSLLADALDAWQFKSRRSASCHRSKTGILYVTDLCSVRHQPS
jgi:hypothetical protein